MGRQIIKQPNGKFAVWSTNSDAIILYDASESELVNYFVEREIKRIADDIRQICAELHGGGKPYYQWTMTWDEALKEHEENHGPLAGVEI